MTPQEAINVLRRMQAQIIHGKNTFGDIADCIEKLIEKPPTPPVTKTSKAPYTDAVATNGCKVTSQTIQP